MDGINAGDGYIRQFVAMPLGMGYSVEGQLTGKEEFGGMQIIVYDPLPGKFPDQPPKEPESDRMDILFMAEAAPAPPEMGLAAGGRMRQKLYPDEYGADTWDMENYGRLYVHIVNSMMFRDITGLEPPPTPVSARLYTQHGFPWFDLYDEEKADVDPSEELAGVKSVKQMDKKKGFGNQQDDAPVEIAGKQIEKLHPGGQKIKDGEW